MKKVALLAAVLLAAGCTRDLALPGATAFSVTAEPATVAPRQQATLTVTGGVGALQFAFDAGGKLSGDDATLVADGGGRSATYTSGRNGSTQDAVTVTDSLGSVRRVIITVGPRLSVTPFVTGTAPGGTLTFVASGGKAPYTFFATFGAVTTSGTDGHYTASSSYGDVLDTVTVTDATGDMAAAATAQVRIGTRLQLYRPSTGPVAPNELVTVVAFGGQPPYSYGPPIDPLQPELGGFASPTRGEYTVGTAGLTVATAVVTDDVLQTASIGMVVGRVLTAGLANAQVRPGVANRIEASGGKPPYTFRFAPRGNHSGGVVEQFTGAYLPGPSPGALDRLEVEDATGTIVALTDVVPVGPIEIATGTDGDRCVAGDFDGDGAQDLAFLFRGMSLLEVNRIASADPLYRSYYVGTGFQFPASFVTTKTNTTRSDLLFTGVRSGGPVGGAGFWALVPDMTGLFANPNNLMVTGFTGSQGTVFRDGSTTNYLSSDGAGCTNSLQMVPWNDAMGSASLRTCSPTIANLAGLGTATAMAAGDFGGDGLEDLAWLASSTDPYYANTWNTPGPLHVRTRSGAGFIEGTSLVLPTGTVFEGQGNGEQNRVLRIPARPGAAAEGLLIRLRDNQTGGRGALAFASGSPLTWRYPRFDPFAGAGSGATAFSLVSPSSGGSPLVAVFAGNDGKVAVFDPWAATPTATLVADVTFPASFGCSVDADADGFPDLSVGGERSGLSRLLWGDGAGGFGTRPRLAAAVTAVASGDVDGDGLVDLVAADGQSVTALFGDEGQVGWSETPITSLPVAALAVDSFINYGGGLPAGTGAIIFQTIDADYYSVRSKGGGEFHGEVPMTVGLLPPTGVPRIAHSWLLSADLGGLAFGPDLLAPENDNFGNGWVHLIRRNSETSATEAVSPIVGDYRVTGGTILKTHQCAYAPVSTGSNFAVAALCSFEVPPGQPAASWRVRGWPIDEATPGWYYNPWVDAGAGGINAGVAGTETGAVAIGTFGGKAYFVVATDRLYLAVVSPGANALAPAGWTVTTTQLTATRHTTPYFARTADFDGDGKLDAVLGGEGWTTVLGNSGTNAAPIFGFRYEVPAAGLPIAAGPLGFIDAARTVPEKPSVLLFGLSGGGVQILRTDGAGGLR